ncbi:PRC-barrel domain-containing protein [Streptomyces poriticola]|uniref:PRC-barrel domain-containing protein n=1 Tax=Streptomyces poriticola TaxID=3120506 RepID=UPI002FCDF351
MEELMASRSLTTRPVVTLDGDAVAEVRDTVFDAGAGRIAGFTLSGRGLLPGPLRLLPWPAVHALGHDAVMVRDARALTEVSAAVARKESEGGRLLGTRVLTDEGTEVGTVLDVVEGGTAGRVVGFRVAPNRRFGPVSHRRRRTVYVPRGEPVTVSGRTLVLPADAVRHAADGLDGLSAPSPGRPGDGRDPPA